MNEATIKLSKEMQPLAMALEQTIDEIAGEHQLFCLVVFTEGRSSYVSNAVREDVKKALQELIECWDKGMPDVPAHEYQG